MSISTVLNNLKAHNEGSANREIIEAHKAKVQAARDAGPSAEIKKQSAIMLAIYDQLKHFTDVCTYDALEFYERDITVEDGRVFGTFGWKAGTINFPFYISVSIDDVWSSGHGRFGFGSKPTGKSKIFVGGYGDRKLFKELKVGGFKYEEIAREIFFRIQGEKKKAQLAAVRNNNRSAVQQVVDGLDEEFKNYNGLTIGASEDVTKPVMMYIDVKRHMTIEAAIELANVLKKHGIG